MSKSIKVTIALTLTVTEILTYQNLQILPFISALALTVLDILTLHIFYLQKVDQGHGVGLGDLVVTHSAAGAKGPGFNSRVARAYLRFNSRPSTLAGKQCWLCAVRLQQTVTV